MAELVEIPEAKEPFEKRVAITIAIIAVVLSIISTSGDHARTSAIIETNQASDQWAFYQAKSLKMHMQESEGRIIEALKSGSNDEKAGMAVKANEDGKKKYEAELKEIREKAEELTSSAKHESKINQRLDLSEMIMQISIVLCSVAILSNWKKLWITGMITASAGFAVGLTAFFM